MKKVYAMMALALAVGLGATAAPKVDVSMAQPVDTRTMVADFSTGTGVAVVNPAMASAPAKAITSTKELEGLKQWNGILMFNQKEHQGTIINGPQTGIAFAQDARDTRITIMNFPSDGLRLNLTVDMANKEVSFNSGVKVGDVNVGNGVIKACNIYVRKNNGDIVYDEKDGLYHYSGKAEACDKAVGKILDDGRISFDGYTMLAQSPDMVEEGSVYLMLLTANIVFEQTPWNTPVESEYTYVGLGEYADPFFSPLYTDPSVVPVNKKAEIYTKKDGDNLMIAVKNPYKEVPATVEGENGQPVELTDFWKQTQLMYEAASEDGWLLFEVFQGDKFKEYPNAAAMIQMVPCGMEIDGSEDGDGSEVEMYYPFNLEGDVLYSVGEDGLLLRLESMLLNNLEYSALEGNVLSIRNPLFGVGTTPTSPLWWNNKDQGVGTVTMPEGWSAGVNTVMVDNENAPVKYYNLQGIELNEPVKGQLTIRKQGSKSTKFIAR